MEENGIKYKQISGALMLVFVLVIALFVMGVILVPVATVGFFRTYQQTKSNAALVRGIGFCVLEVYLIYGLIINIVLSVLTMRLQLEKHPKLYPFLTFSTCNIPCGFLMIKSIKNNSDVDE